MANPEEANDLPAEPISEVRLKKRRKLQVVRSRTINVHRESVKALEAGRLEYPEEITDKPQTRADCAGVARPCPYVSCEYNLYLDVERSGSIKFNFPDREPEDMVHSCALDIADRGGVTLERVGELMNVTRERVRQIEEKAFKKVLREHARELRKMREPTKPEPVALPVFDVE